MFKKIIEKIRFGSNKTKTTENVKESEEKSK
jgi:hypothetical protein